MKRLLVLLLVSILVPVLVAHATVYHVIVADFQFDPATLNILQGDTVIWQDTLGFHSVTQDCNAGLFGQPAAPSPWTYQFAFNVPVGVYAYHCEIHPDHMMGTIVVGDRTHWQVAVRNFFFDPANITITQGDTVTWTNNSGLHDVHETSVPSLFGNTSGFNWTYTFVFNLPPALYHYICTIHGFAGTVNELAPPSISAPANLVAYNADTTESHVKLWWDRVCGATGYAVFRSSDPSPSLFPDSLGMTADTTWTDSTANPKDFYLVRSLSTAAR